MAKREEFLVAIQCRVRILELIAEGINTPNEIAKKVEEELPVLCAKCKATPRPDKCIKYPPPKRFKKW